MCVFSCYRPLISSLRTSATRPPSVSTSAPSTLLYLGTVIAYSISEKFFQIIYCLTTTSIRLSCTSSISPTRRWWPTTFPSSRPCLSGWTSTPSTSFTTKWVLPCWYRVFKSFVNCVRVRFCFCRLHFSNCSLVNYKTRRKLLKLTDFLKEKTSTNLCLRLPICAAYVFGVVA